MKRTKPVFYRCHLDFTKRDFAVCLGKDVKAAMRLASKKLKIDFGLSDSDYSANALCVSLDNGAVVLAFSYKDLCASLICHEVTHATHTIFTHIGIRRSDSSDEAFAYHNDMLFRTVAEVCETHGVRVPLLPPKA